MISGANGSGKTSLCEAVSLLFHGRSFRSSAPFSVLIRENTLSLQLRALVQSLGHEVIQLFMQKSLSGRCIVKCDGEDIQRLKDITQLLPLMILTPEVGNLIDVEPAVRRKFIDWLMFHVEHQYSEIFRQYQNCLKQRNYLLRIRNKFDDELKVWTEELVRYGSVIGQLRDLRMKEVNIIFKNLVQSTEFEGYQVLLASGWSGGSLKKAVHCVAQMELRRRMTLVGPHRADLIFVDRKGQKIKSFRSRGEKKWLSTLFSLALLQYLAREHNKKSVLIIDDWRAELDEMGREWIIRVIQESKIQTIVTTTEQNDDRYLSSNSRMFHVEHGCIRNM